MSTQQDIYAAGFKNRPPMLNKENYVPWSSRLLCYAKSRPNGKLIYNSIMNGPYVIRMIPEPGDLARTVPVPETFHEQTDDELTKVEIKQMEDDDQAIQTILLILPEDIYAAVDSCEVAQEIWLRVQQMMKGSDIGIQEKKVKLFNEWERFTSTNEESIESYYHRFSKLMNDFKRNKHFPEKFVSNLKFLNNLQLEWSRHVTIVHQTKDLHTTDYTQLYDFLKYNQKEVDELRAERLEKTQDPLALMHGNGNVIAARAEGNSNEINGNQLRCYNCRGEGHYANNCTVKPRKRDAAYLQTQLHIAQKDEAGIQLNSEEFDFMPAAGAYDEIEKVTVNYNLQDNLQQASTSGTQSDKALVYDSDGSAEVYHSENCYDNDIFNMFTQEEQYIELLEPIPEPHQVQQNDSNVIFAVSSVEQSRRTVEQHPENVKKTRVFYDSLYNNLAIETEKVNLEKSIVSSLLEDKKKLKSDFKIREDKLLDKQIQLENKIKELDNILVKTGQSIQTMHMLSPKPDSFYHTEQKMALGYQNPFYLKQAQQKQQSLYNGKVLLEKHDPPAVYDSEETLELAQESRLKMKQLNKEIKPANYTKINHLSGVFVSQTAKSREELYFSNTSKTANVSKSISIPNEEFSDDTTPSVARKFLNEVKSTIVTLQRVVKQKMTLDIHNWSSYVHQEIHKVIKDKIFPIINQVDARVQNFKIQFLKEAAKFVQDFKSLAKEADESLAKHKTLEMEIERLLREVVDTLDPLSQKLENENVELEFQVRSYERENAHLKTAYKNLFDSINVTRTQTKTIIDSLQTKLHDTIYENAKLRAQLFDKVFERKDTTKGTSVNTQFCKQSILGKPPSSSGSKLYFVTPFPKSKGLPKIDESHALSKPVTSNLVPTPTESKVMKNDNVISS
ncbi:retrovirus-related pol polyprotein from transposon TNT 1-94 [Tanacetum coccineum]